MVGTLENLFSPDLVSFSTSLLCSQSIPHLFHSLVLICVEPRAWFYHVTWECTNMNVQMRNQFIFSEHYLWSAKRHQPLIYLRLLIQGQSDVHPNLEQLLCTSSPSASDNVHPSLVRLSVVQLRQGRETGWTSQWSPNSSVDDWTLQNEAFSWISGPQGLMCD